MKNKFKVLLLILITISSFITNVSAQEKVDVYLFYSETCPHCKAEIKMLDELSKENKNIIIHKYEVNDSNNYQLWKRKRKELGVKSSGVPLTVIGDEYFEGYADYYNKKDIINAINKELGINNEGNNNAGGNTNNDKSNKTVNIPFFGEVEPKGFLLPVVTIILGTLDGFNPCAMWILLFLVSVLMGMKDRKRMWILGITFIMTSAIVYALFMIGWLKIIQSLIWLRYLVAVLAIIGGLFNAISIFKKKNDGCEVVDDKKRKRLFSRIRKVVSEQKFILAILGIMMLAISVNLIELICSASLPATFTQILKENNVSNFENFIYIFIYILFFMIDDIIIFIIAMTTLKLTGLSTKYGKISKIVGGIIMVIIGILLIINPGLLVFS